MSFKLKLLVYFALLALLPVAISFYGYATLAHRSATERADARLDAELRAAIGAYGTRMDQAAATARALAMAVPVQRALIASDRAALADFLKSHPHAVVRSADLSVGAVASGAPSRRVDVKRQNRLIGTVIVWVPLDAALTATVADTFRTGDRVVVIRNGRVVAGFGRGAPISLHPETAARTSLAGVAFRGLSGPPLPETEGARLAALTPQRIVESGESGVNGRLLVSVLAALAVVGAVTYLLGRSIVGTLRRLVRATDAIADGRLDVRVEASGRDEFGQLGRAFNRMAAELEAGLIEIASERRRVQGVTAGFVSVLADTHDEESLLRAVTESAVQAAGGTGGLVVRDNVEIVRVGEPERGRERLSFPLRAGTSDYGTLVVRGATFETEVAELTASLAAQAVTALENARRHQVVQQHAVLDELTGLANRRSIDATLHAALDESSRRGSSVTLVLADIDRFKTINDEYGHLAGDRVLTSVARVLEDVTREQDLAGRWGGEEFALVLASTDVATGAAIAERARLTLEQTSDTTDGSDIRVTASFGVASYPRHRDFAELVAAADRALYQAKRTGRNRVVRDDEL